MTFELCLTWLSLVLCYLSGTLIIFLTMFKDTFGECIRKVPIKDI